MEQRSKKAFVLATSRTKRFNSRLNLEFDSLTEELEGMHTSLERTTDTNGRLRAQLAVSSSGRENLLK